MLVWRREEKWGLGRKSQKRDLLKNKGEHQPKFPGPEFWVVKQVTTLLNTHFLLPLLLLLRLFLFLFFAIHWQKRNSEQWKLRWIPCGQESDTSMEKEGTPIGCDREGGGVEREMENSMWSATPCNGYTLRLPSRVGRGLASADTV